MKLGLQLYTVRDAFGLSPQDTLKKLRRMGYESVELFAPLSQSAGTMKAMCADAGLAVPSVMFFYESLRDELSSVIATCEKIGNRLAVCPWLAEDYRSVSGYSQVAKTLDLAATKLAQVGVTLCYHNHDFEFEPLSGGHCGYTILLQQTQHLCFEPDVYWLAYARLDPIESINANAQRCPVVHLKDMATGPDKQFCEVGSGILDMPGIVDTAQAHGIEYAFVEQDACWKNNDPFASVQQSLQWLRENDAVGRYVSNIEKKQRRISKPPAAF